MIVARPGPTQSEANALSSKCTELWRNVTLPGWIESDAAEGKPSLQIWATGDDGSTCADACSGRSGPECKESETKRNTSSLCGPSSSEKNPNRAESRSGETLSEVDTSDTSTRTPIRSSPNEGNGAPDLLRPCKDEAVPRLSLSKAESKRPKQAMANVNRHEPDRAKRWRLDEGSSFTASHTAAATPGWPRLRGEIAESRTK